MFKPGAPMRTPPSPWAVALFVASAAFALISAALLSVEFRPHW